MTEELKQVLAQANIARMVAPLDDPIMAGFVAQLEFINSVADRSPGFIWRLKEETGDATAIRVFDDERILFNMSVWESIEALYEYVYRSEHLQPLRNRRQWFERVEGAHLVLWWVPAGHSPSIEEARERLERLTTRGPSAQAFTFRQPFSASGAALDLPRQAGWTTAP